MSGKPVRLETKRLKPGTSEPTAPPAPDQAAAAVFSYPLTPEQVKELETKVVDVLHTCYDPEIPVNIYELGLIYKLDVQPEGAVKIDMTLTSPGCPVAGTLPGEIEAKVKTVPGVTSAKATVVWEPPWDKSRMSEAAMLELGLF